MADKPRRPSPEYSRARSRLVLASATLLLWEFVGIDLSLEVHPIVDALQKPEFVPWAILIIVAYLLFRHSTEWILNGDAEAMHPRARLEYRASQMFALAAIGAFTVPRTLFDTRLYEILTTDEAMWFSAWSIITFLLLRALLTSRRWPTRAGLVVGAVCIWLVSPFPLDQQGLIALAAGVVVGLLLGLFTRSIKNFPV